MESCDDAILKYTLLDYFLFVNNCMLYGHSKQLDLYWLYFFGKFGIVEKTVLQLLCDLWYIQDRIKYFSMLHCNYLLVNNGKANSCENLSYTDEYIL